MNRTDSVPESHKCDVCGTSDRLFFVGLRDDVPVFACNAHIGDVETDEDEEE